MLQALTLRQATPADIPALRALIENSVRVLQAADYTPAQLDLALGTVFGVDRQLIADGTYWLAERDGVILGCGGWSYRATMHGSDGAIERDDTKLVPGRDAARIRAMFVAPAAARQGVGTAILRACEAAAVAAGFTSLELSATLTGIPLYERHGYVAVARELAAMTAREGLEILRMRKDVLF